jgi:hypothetical protein
MYLTQNCEAKLFLNTVWQESKAGLSMRVYDLDAGVWILDPWCTRLNLIEHGKFHSRYPCLRFVYLRLFQGLWLGTFLQVARGADLTTVNSEGERSVVRLVEWLLTLGAQDGYSQLGHCLCVCVRCPARAIDQHSHSGCTTGSLPRQV